MGRVKPGRYYLSSTVLLYVVDFATMSYPAPERTVVVGHQTSLRPLAQNDVSQICPRTAHPLSRRGILDAAKSQTIKLRASLTSRQMHTCRLHRQSRMEGQVSPPRDRRQGQKLRPAWHRLPVSAHQSALTALTNAESGFKSQQGGCFKAICQP